MDRPPTLDQMLVLVNRAERGQLAPAEAARLRQGLVAMDESRRASQGRATTRDRRQRETVRRLLAIQSLVRSARQRGARSIPVSILVSTVQPEADRQAVAS